MRFVLVFQAQLRTIVQTQILYEPKYKPKRTYNDLIFKSFCYRELILQTLIADAGWPIWPLLLISVIALAIIIERILSLREARVIPASLVRDVKRMLNANTLTTEDLERLTTSCTAGPMVSGILRNRSQDAERIREVAQENGSDISLDLNRYLPLLGTIGTVAPLMGLFGTVVGMIEIFAIFEPGGADPGLLARGISVALYNAGFGILIAIPALIAHRILRMRADTLLHKIELAGRDVIELIRTPKTNA